jgi:hypothetical protein
MAQEDKGLILRGLLLLTFIGALVTFVLGFMLWRQQPADVKTLTVAPENLVALVALPGASDYPAGVSWLAVQQMAETMPSAPGWEVRYNAAATLARRGSSEVPWQLIREMLDEPSQRRNYLVRHPDGRAVYDEAAARANMITALRALAAWHEKQKTADKTTIPADLQAIYAQVDRLTESPYVELKIQATKAQSTFLR